MNLRDGKVLRRSLHLAGLLCTFVGLLSGCSHPAGQLAPGDHVYVNVARIAELRPEWQGVQQLDQQIARLRAALAQANGISAGSPTLIPPTLIAPTTGAVDLASSPDTAALKAAVDASTPSPEELQAELEKEAEGEQKLFNGGVRRKYDASQREQEQQMDSASVDLRIGILRQFEEDVVNLWLKQAVLEDLAAKLQPPLYGPPPASRRYIEFQDQLNTLDKALMNTSDPQLRQLRAANASMSRKLDILEHSISPAVAAMLEFRARIEIVGSELSDLQHEQASSLRTGGVRLRGKLTALVAAMNEAIASTTPVQERLAAVRQALSAIHDQEGPIVKQGQTKLHEAIDAALTSLEPTTAATTELQEQLVVVRSVLYNLLQQQERALTDVEAGLQDAMTALQREIAAKIAAEIAKHRQDTEKRIWQQVARAEQDIQEEARQREALFAHSFKSPLVPALALAPMQGNIPPFPPAHAGSAALLRAALLQQIQSLERQRSGIAGKLVRDTQSWVGAIADRRKVIVFYSPLPGATDATNLFTSWIRQRIMPPPA